MWRRIAIAALLAQSVTAGGAAAQSTGDTGTGGALGSLQDIQKQLEEQWNGPPGQVAKGAVGVAGMAMALSAAREALSLEGSLRRDGSVSSNSNAGGGDGGGSTGATSTTGTN